MTKATRESATDDSRPFARAVAKAVIQQLADVFNRATGRQTRPDPIADAMRDPKERARFWAKVAKGKADECWLWQGLILRTGYGAFTLKRRQLLAHRVACTIAHGPIPPGLSVLHSCDVRACCNPRHLRAGTEAENAQDRIDRNRVQRGESHPLAKLTAEDVRAIRASAESDTAAGRRYGVHGGTIGRIRRHETWTHVE